MLLCVVQLGRIGVRESLVFDEFDRALPASLDCNQRIGNQMTDLDVDLRQNMHRQPPAETDTTVGADFQDIIVPYGHDARVLPVFQVTFRLNSQSENQAQSSISSDHMSLMKVQHVPCMRSLFEVEPLFADCEGDLTVDPDKKLAFGGTFPTSRGDIKLIKQRGKLTLGQFHQGHVLLTEMCMLKLSDGQEPVEESNTDDDAAVVDDDDDDDDDDAMKIEIVDVNGKPNSDVLGQVAVHGVPSDRCNESIELKEKTNSNAGSRLKWTLFDASIAGTDVRWGQSLVRYAIQFALFHAVNAETVSKTLQNVASFNQGIDGERIVDAMMFLLKSETYVRLNASLSLHCGHAMGSNHHPTLYSCLNIISNQLLDAVTLTNSMVQNKQKARIMEETEFEKCSSNNDCGENDLQGYEPSETNHKKLLLGICTYCDNLVDIFKESEPSKYESFARLNVKISEIVQGNEHASTANACTRLGSVLTLVNKFDEATKYFKLGLQIRETKYGKDHIETADSYHNLAGLLQEMGQFEQAKKYNLFALQIRETKYGKDHTETATSYNNLAGLLQEMGELQEAKKFYLLALHIFETKYGKDRTSTAILYNNLGRVLQDVGELEEAKKYYSLALQIFETKYGKDHTSTAMSYNILGRVLQEMEEFQEAKKYYSLALQIKETVYGKDHTETATSYNNLAGLLQELGDLEEAKKYYLLALQIKESRLGIDPADTAYSYNSLSGWLQEAGELEQARKFCLFALQIRETKYGKHHTSTAISFNNLGLLLQEMGELEEAKKYYLLALHIRQTNYGKDHTDTQQTLLNLFVLNTCLDTLPSFITSNEHVHCQLTLITKCRHRRCRVCKLKSIRMYSCSEHAFNICLKCAQDEISTKPKTASQQPIDCIG
jgi:tetratricopeptide (TPR) repeat protein